MIKKGFKTLSFLLFVLMLTYSCQNKKQIINKNVYVLNDIIIAPDNCLVEAQIVEIKPVIDKNDGELCSKTPCYAIVKINNVIGYGSSFSGDLLSEKQINVFFKHSLSSSKEIDKNLNYSLPGLAKGDKFKANIEALEQMGKPSIKYTIYYYQKL